MNGKRNYSQFKCFQTRFLLAGAINKVCFILATFVPGVLTTVNARKFSTIFLFA
ncbi:MAG TPA: hypothetical protein VIS75_09570 [Chitinophagaceae bacterium]